MPHHDLKCERCGRGFHERCFWTRMATAAEQREYLATDADQVYAFVCFGCRQ
jgi:predicted Fe-S protein YdhL (DUF1289 family)